MVFRGKRRNTEPLLNIRMPTPKRVKTLIYSILSNRLPRLHTAKPTIIGVVVYSELKFPTLFLEDHNNSQCFVIFNMSCVVSSQRIHNTPAKVIIILDNSKFLYDYFLFSLKRLIIGQIFVTL